VYRDLVVGLQLSVQLEPVATKVLGSNPNVYI